MSYQLGLLYMAHEHEQEALKKRDPISEYLVTEVVGRR